MTAINRLHIPMPNLSIVPADRLHAHEEHDSQRSEPLIARMRRETTMINPPLVAPMDEDHDQYVILDGANRVHALCALDYPHLLVQVVDYDGGLVELDNWQHVVAGWSADEFIQHLRQIPEIRLGECGSEPAITEVLLAGGERLSICGGVASVHERNRLLRQVVAVYQRHAHLHRTASIDPAEIWDAYPDAAAALIFPLYQPADIIAAARDREYLPPGISRHIVQGRAIQVNYPLAWLRDPAPPLKQKNADLHHWVQSKLANREVRYYAEATYQFDE